VVGKADEVKAVSVIGKVFAKYFMNGGIEEGEAGIGKGEFMPVCSDGNVVLSFSLLKIGCMIGRNKIRNSAIL
jgi:phosphatidylinositol glycan class S